MGTESITNLLGKHESDPMTNAISQELSKVLGKDVKVAPPVKNGYRNEKGKVFLRDIDPDEIKKTW